MVAPAVLSRVWEQEIETWSNGLAEFTFTSYSKLAARTTGNRVLPKPRAEFAVAWDTVVFDEAHYLKNRKANWTKAALKLKSERVYLLSGTPVSGWAHELWTLLRFVNPDDLELRSYWRWVETWFSVWSPPWGGTEVKGLRKGLTWEEFAEGCNLEGKWLRRTQAEKLSELPPLTTQTLEVELTGEQKRVYRSLSKEFVAEVESGLEVAWSEGSKAVKLAKVRSGLGVLDPAYGVRHSAKLEVLRLLLAEREEPTLVLCYFQRTAELVGVLAAELGLSVGVVHGGVAVSERQNLAEQLQSGELQVLVGTVATLGEGLTLTAATCAVFLERSPRPSQNEQAQRRIYRFGQTKPCLVVDVVVAEDSALLARLSAKLGEQSEVLLALSRG